MESLNLTVWMCQKYVKKEDFRKDKKDPLYPMNYLSRNLQKALKEFKVGCTLESHVCKHSDDSDIILFDAQIFVDTQ